MVKRMELEFNIKTRRVFLKEYGLITKRMEEVLNYFLMVHSILDNIRMENQKELVNFNGKMMRRMKDNGFKERNMDLEFGKDLKEILILENGKWGFPMDMVYINGLMVIVMKENLKIV